MTRFLLTSLTITWLGACGDKEETDTGTTDGDADTDADTDTDAPDTDAVEPPVTTEEYKDGCGCAARPSRVGLGPWLVAIAVAGSRRRRRQSGTIPA